MRGFFNYDNPVWRFIGKFWDVFILNILWLVCSLPIITIGASTTAMYYVTLRLVRDEDGYTFRSFFHSFKQNFKQATIIWLIFLVAGIILLTDVWFVLTAGVVPQGTARMVFTALFVGMFIIWFAMLTYVFPILARFYGTVKQTLLNSFLLSVRYILYTIAMIAVDIAIVYLALTSLPFLMMFGLALIAFVNSYFLHQVFKHFIPEETENIQEVRPLFSENDEDDEKAALFETFIRRDDDEDGEKSTAQIEAEPEPAGAVNVADGEPRQAAAGELQADNGSGSQESAEESAEQIETEPEPPDGATDADDGEPRQVVAEGPCPDENADGEKRGAEP